MNAKRPAGMLRRASMVLVAVATATAVLASGDPASSEVVVDSANSSAFGEQVKGPVFSGPLPYVVAPPGGSASAAGVNLPNVLRTGILNAAASTGKVGTSTGYSKASASAAYVKVGNNLLPVLTADLVTSQCRADASGVSGSSDLTNLRIRLGGVLKLQAKVPMPNTVINVPGVARIVLNEQIKSADSITVNAVHVTLLGASPGLEEDIILSQSRCSATKLTVTTTSSSTSSSSSSSSSSSTSSSIPQPPATCTTSVFSHAEPPAANSFPDTEELELGVNLTADVNVRICAVVFYKAAGATGIHSVKVWNAATKTVIATGALTVMDAAAAWITVSLDAEVAVTAGTSITASYHTPGPFVKTSGYDWSPDEGALNATSGGFRYGPTQFPDQGGAADNFWVDVVFATT